MAGVPRHTGAQFAQPDAVRLRTESRPACYRSAIRLEPMASPSTPQISAPLDAPGTWTTLDLENANSIFTLNGGKITASVWHFAPPPASPMETRRRLNWPCRTSPLPIKALHLDLQSRSADHCHCGRAQHVDEPPLLTKINVVGGSLTFAADVTSGNMLTATTTESAAENGSSGVDDKIIVAPNATVAKRSACSRRSVNCPILRSTSTRRMASNGMRAPSLYPTWRMCRSRPVKEIQTTTPPC